MTLRRREALALAGVGLAAATAGLFLGPWLLRRDAGGAGSTLAAARLNDLAGRERSLADWRGTIVVLNFWATWCAPCLEEIPMLIEARNQYVVKGVEIVGIAIDNADKVSEYVSKAGVRYPILLGAADGLELMRKLGNKASALPFTVVLDGAGNPQARKLGALSRAELDSMLATLLARG